MSPPRRPLVRSPIRRSPEPQKRRSGARRDDVPPIEPLLTPAQVGERLGIDVLDVVEQIRLGHLPALKVRGRWRIGPGDLPGLGARPG